MRKFVLGDIHGRIEALLQVLVLAKFDYENDKLILLGDIVDGGYNTYEVVEELLKIKNLVFVIGNHDEWYMDHIRSGWSGDIWLSQGGKNTIASYKKYNYDYGNMPVTHQEFFNKGVYYHIEDNKLFVHGGYDPKYPIEKQTKEVLTWDRQLIERCRNGLKIKIYDRVFVGHTTTQSYDWDATPLRFGKLIMMDTGAGWNGRLAMMDIDNEKVFLSNWQDIPARGYKK
jgi:serine/threonine protein phosphatase 1